jgi:hypothetical protein
MFCFRLHIDGNKPGHEGMKELATCLKNNTTLKVLTIHNSDLEVEDVLDFLDVLGSTSSLELLGVKKNNNLTKHSKELKESLEKYNFLRVVY